jgi:hypothetical protein
MTAVRKIVDSRDLAGIFELPPALENRKIEVLLLPVEEPVEKAGVKWLTKAQIEEWAKAPKIQALRGVLRGTNLPADITSKDIRDRRLAEKYGL